MERQQNNHQYKLKVKHFLYSRMAVKDNLMFTTSQHLKIIIKIVPAKPLI